MRAAWTKRSENMSTLSGKNAVVIGGSRSVGRAIVMALHAEGARVLAVARNPGPLAELAAALPGVETLVLDATAEDAPARVFAAINPDLIVHSGGATPPMQPVHEQDWETFSRNWNTDVRVSFLFSKAALTRPLKPGSTVILISSGAALGGSPISGGYAGSKRTQMFLANYAQKESDRAKLDLRLLALAPMRIMPSTELGAAAVAGYASYIGRSEAEFVAGMDSPQTPDDVAKAVIEFATNPNARQGNVFGVSGKGVEAIA
jgi:NAD(P)-dependent dehydrogenase (short-subunit alcohol dehydrogenase family)